MDYLSPDLRILQGDCLQRMAEVADQSVELILCDLPYGTTACTWDSIIPLEAMWEHYRRIITPKGAIVLTAAQPFTSVLAVSNLEWFKYTWVWEKNRPTNFAHAKNKPMKKHEDVLVFSPGTTVHASQSPMRMTYNPQGVQDTEAKKVTKKASEKTDAFFADRPGHGEFTRNKTGYPHSIIKFSTDQLGLHPTAKPIDLMRYLIRTYSHPGETVMDNCLGSGTTGIAAVMENRQFVGMERDPKYFQMSRERILATLAKRDNPTPPESDGDLFS
jgi:site-specific DNA-methyltransferase (adenine-specific)